MTEVKKIEHTIHKLRGLLQAINNFVDCMDESIEGARSVMISSEVKEYCSVIIMSIHEVEGLVKEIGYGTN